MDLDKLTQQVFALFPNSNVFRVAFALQRFQADGLKPWSVHVKVDSRNLFGSGNTPEDAIKNLK